jgi:hypothetical protein
LRKEPTLREVYRSDKAESEYIMLETYTIPQAAEALGKSQITLKKWIDEALIPPPVLACGTYGYALYSVGELQLIAEFLKSYQQDRVYLSKTEASELESLRQRFEGYRRSSL